MGALGSEVAVASDIAIMSDRLTHLPWLVGHARRTRRIIVQNLVLSGVIIATLVPLAGVAVHEVAEIVVIANGLRARRTSAIHTPIPIILTAPRRAPART